MSQDSYNNYQANYSNTDNQKSYSYTDFDKSFDSSSFGNQSSFGRQSSAGGSSNENSYTKEASFATFSNDNFKQDQFYKTDKQSYKQPEYQSKYNDYSNDDRENSKNSYVDGNKNNYQNSYSTSNSKNYSNTNNSSNVNNYSSSYQNQPYQRESNASQNYNASKIPKISKTIKDLLQMPAQRQQYLKQLSNEQLIRQNQYIVMFSRPNILLGLSYYYQRIIPNQQFNQKVKSIKLGKDIKQVLYISSILAYVYSTGKLSRPTSGFKGIYKGNSHYLIPVVLTGLMIFDNANTRNKTKNLVQDRSNLPFFNIAIRKFLCQANHKQKMQILSQT